MERDARPTINRDDAHTNNFGENSLDPPMEFISRRLGAGASPDGHAGVLLDFAASSLEAFAPNHDLERGSCLKLEVVNKDKEKRRRKKVFPRQRHLAWNTTITIMMTTSMFRWNGRMVVLSPHLDRCFGWVLNSKDLGKAELASKSEHISKIALLRGSCEFHACAGLPCRGKNSQADQVHEYGEK